MFPKNFRRFTDTLKEGSWENNVKTSTPSPHFHNLVPRSVSVDNAGGKMTMARDLFHHLKFGEELGVDIRRTNNMFYGIETAPRHSAQVLFALMPTA